MNILNPNYEKFYALYKKLPAIASITWAALVFMWSIIDVSVFSSRSYYYGNSYGIMSLDYAFLVLIIWWAIGAVLSLLTWFFSSLIVSATVTRTDAIVEIKNNLNKN